MVLCFTRMCETLPCFTINFFFEDRFVALNVQCSAESEHGAGAAVEASQMQHIRKLPRTLKQTLPNALETY